MLDHELGTVWHNPTELFKGARKKLFLAHVNDPLVDAYP
jgi:hypothetical protein